MRKKLKDDAKEEKKQGNARKGKERRITGGKKNEGIGESYQHLVGKKMVRSFATNGFRKPRCVKEVKEKEWAQREHGGRETDISRLETREG